jgi:hypothetical protein
MSLISAVTARGHMRFMIKEKGGVNADVFIEFLKRLMVGATHPIFLIVDRGPAHRAKKTKAFVETLGGKLRLFFCLPSSSQKKRSDTPPECLISGFACGKSSDLAMVRSRYTPQRYPCTLGRSAFPILNFDPPSLPTSDIINQKCTSP